MLQHLKDRQGCSQTNLWLLWSHIFGNDFKSKQGGGDGGKLTYRIY